MRASRATSVERGSGRLLVHQGVGMPIRGWQLGPWLSQSTEGTQVIMMMVEVATRPTMLTTGRICQCLLAQYAPHKYASRHADEHAERAPVRREGRSAYGKRQPL